MKKLIYFATALMFLSFQSNGQDEGFMYGKVTTIDGKSYEGALRWGKEEVYWTDMFNASKIKNQYLDVLTDEQRENMEEHYYKTSGSWGDSWGKTWNRWTGGKYEGDNKHQHQFVCQFGNLKSVRPTGREEAEIVMRDGNKFDVDGSGYNDVATKIAVIDKELGQITIEWSRIELVEFMDTPKTLSNKFGEPLFGTVETYVGSFTGFIQWDHDERVGEDKLDGDTEDGKMSIPFKNIGAIERQGFRCMVTLKSGRSLEMSGSNDINRDNRGIIVSSPEFGRIDIPFKEFKKVTFNAPTNLSLVSYAAFVNSKKLSGIVRTTDGKELKGDIVYDLDESFGYETLQGKADDVEYLIPFSNISKISPKNYDFSEVTLKSGETKILGEGQDVSDKNSGIIVHESKSTTYIMWDQIEVITFN